MGFRPALSEGLSDMTSWSCQQPDETQSSADCSTSIAERREVRLDRVSAHDGSNLPLVPFVPAPANFFTLAENLSKSASVI